MSTDDDALIDIALSPEMLKKFKYFVGVGLERSKRMIMFISFGIDRGKVESDVKERVEHDLPPGINCDGTTVIEIAFTNPWETQLRHWLFEAFDLLGSDADHVVRSFKAGLSSMIEGVAKAREARKSTTAEPLENKGTPAVRSSISPSPTQESP